MNRTRCRWCNLSNPRYVAYHDNEWGLPLYDDRILFEFLVLESFQAGLSWETILNKRENFRRAFDNFDPIQISRYGEDKIRDLLADPGIVRNRRKIEAAIINAAVYLRIQENWGSFHKYIWHFTNGMTIYESNHTSSELSDRISNDLKEHGMKFVGTTIIYSYLQAVGIIHSHEKTCFLYKSHDLL